MFRTFSSPALAFPWPARLTSIQMALCRSSSSRLMAAISRLVRPDVEALHPFEQGGSSFGCERAGGDREYPCCCGHAASLPSGYDRLRQGATGSAVVR
jgi:hypothetical protein